MIGNNNNSIKGAGPDIKSNHKYNYKLNLKSNNPIINYINNKNKAIMNESRTIKGASNNNNNKTICQDRAIEALKGLSSICKV